MNSKNALLIDYFEDMEQRKIVFKEQLAGYIQHAYKLGAFVALSGKYTEQECIDMSYSYAKKFLKENT